MSSTLSALDRLFIERAYELAARALGSTAPNPPVGAVVVRDGRVLGEGFHHRAGAAHAEVKAMEFAGDVRGATVYVSLEPCDHIGRTPACSQSLIDAGVARVVVGTLDPNPKTDGAGLARLRRAGIEVDVADDRHARELIAPFAYAIGHDRPFVALKMAMSLDGFIASKAGRTERITGEEVRSYVRDLRVAYDAVMVGAGTVRVDDPQLTVRPPAHRTRPFTRIVACETNAIPSSSRVLAPVEGYARTLLLAPAGARDRFTHLQSAGDVMFVGDAGAMRLDLSEAMRMLRRIGIESILCEGGPRIAARLIDERSVNYFYWAIAPRMLASEESVPVLQQMHVPQPGLRLQFERSECIGEDVVLAGAFHYV